MFNLDILSQIIKNEKLNYWAERVVFDEEIVLNDYFVNLENPAIKHEYLVIVKDKFKYVFFKESIDENIV